MPLPPILWNVFQVWILRQSKRGCLCAPSRHSREAIRTVADHRQVVRNRLGHHSELGYHASFVAQNVAPAVQLNHPRAHYTLTEIFVWGANEHLSHTLIARGFRRGGRERVISLKVDHWPHHHSHAL